MDIYQYINSPEVADFWREKDRIFTAAEAAYIVNLCARLNFVEKCVLWEEIIREYPDCPFGEFDSVHTFLRQYMRLSLSLKEYFCSAHGNPTYTYHIENLFKDDFGMRLYTEETQFHDFDSSLQDFLSQNQCLQEHGEGIIERRTRTGHRSASLWLRMYVNDKGEMLNIFASSCRPIFVNSSGELVMENKTYLHRTCELKPCSVILEGFSMQPFLAPRHLSIGDVVIDISRRRPRPLVIWALPKGKQDWDMPDDGEAFSWDDFFVEGCGYGDSLEYYCERSEILDLLLWEGELTPQMEIEQRYIRKEITDVEKNMAFLKLMREQNTPSAP